ncbi:protein ECT2 isoform X2 [Athalia rosae]|uniref:protein ECT2 isoform X2 n=1 Tax=Athalia rosae TaxID=37344 RepID=UPI0020337A9A|nr:protein ECT2 isoform X2 [Athalia rosae]
MEEQSVHSSTSDINSEEAAKTEPLIIPRKKRICLVGSTGEDPALGAAAQQFSVPVLKSETGTEYLEDTTYCTYFILMKFEGPEYDALHKSAHRILGPTALLQLAEKKDSLPSINRPMYTQAMLGSVVVFTGFRKKEELTKLINMIHSMGGSIRKEMGVKVTHLIANCCGGDKYRYAVTFRVPIMSMDWVTALWDARDDLTSFGSNDKLIAAHKLKPFFGAKVCFFGFPDEEKKHMCEVLQQQGGEPAEIDDPNCTHVVTDKDDNCGTSKSVETNSIPVRSKYPPFSFTYYNPYTNQIPTIDKRNGNAETVSSHFKDSGQDLDNPKCKKNSETFSDHRECTRQSNSGMNETSSQYDSAISLDSTSFIPDDSCDYAFDFIANISSSTRTSQGSDEGFVSLNSSQLFSTCSNFCREDDDTSSSSLFKITTEMKKEKKSFKSIESVTPLNIIQPKNRSKKTLWKKSKSCILVSKPLPSTRSKIFFRNHSQPNLSNFKMTTKIFRKNSVPAHPQFSRFRTLLLHRMINHAGFPSNFCPRNLIPNSRNLYPKIHLPRRRSQRTLGPNLSTTRNWRIGQRTADHQAITEKMETENENPDFLPVVDESNVNSLPDLASVRAHIVKAEWFWTSVQNEGAADEKEYLFEDYLESVVSPLATARRDSQAATPTTASTRRKRKRLAETLSSLVQNGADSPAVHKRRSSISDAGHLSVSGSFLDCTSSPDKQLDEVEAASTETTRKNLSPRHQVFLELVTTESNYVGILSTIMTLFKSPLEDLIETSGELLNSTEAKIIFGNFPPIYEVHKRMLEELRYNAGHWVEDVSIGNIFLKYAPDLVKAYPPYVNFFENTKEMLEECDQNKPRFHAFLKICQTKPECGRQSLKELLIKPVQRLPSISLLLNDILKHTNKNNPDHSALELSISSIKEVMTYINEDKRKTEGQLVMFDIFNEIDNCPPHLVSSHRSFIGKCEVMELGEGLSGRGDHLVLFLFTDTLEICKKRSKAFNSLKSPKEANGLHPTKLSQGKPYKHIRMLSLNTIKRVVDIKETDECHKVFALMVRSNQELKEKLFSFTITDEEVNKTNYLRILCRQMANSVCKADADTFLISLDSHQLEIDTSDVALGTLSKAFKSLFHNFYLEYMDPYVFLLNSMCETTLHVPLPFASRTRMKVGRAFSFNKTPSKLKRAMSTMMSPFGSTNSLTPASQQLAQMRLASCNNINELGNGGSGSPTRDDVLVAPMSVQPTRKAKCSSLSMASLRRNCSEEVVQEKKTEL